MRLTVPLLALSLLAGCAGKRAAEPKPADRRNAFDAAEILHQPAPKVRVARACPPAIVMPPEPIVWQPPVVATVPAADVIALLQEQTVRVRFRDDIGSGPVFADCDGGLWVLTCAHVVSGARKPDGWHPIAVGMHGGKPLDLLESPAEVGYYSDRHDLALLRVGSRHFPAKVATLAKGPSKAGREVYICGSPAGQTGTVHRGIISFAGRVVDGLAWDQTDAVAIGGNSGGPCADASTGEVVGVVQSVSDPEHGITWLVPAQRVREWLASEDASFVVDHSSPVPWRWRK
jgi:S1-C subfamily serine protease